jgi:hypothetical protein
MPRALLALGSNLGGRAAAIRAALAGLNAAGCTVRPPDPASTDLPPLYNYGKPGVVSRLGSGAGWHPAACCAMPRRLKR